MVAKAIGAMTAEYNRFSKVQEETPDEHLGKFFEEGRSPLTSFRRYVADSDLAKVFRDVPTYYDKGNAIASLGN